MAVEASAPAPAGKIGVWTLLVAIMLVAILALYAVGYTVPAGNVAVLKTFGSIAKVVKEPGLHWKAPAPVQSAQLIDMRPRLLKIRDVELSMAGLFNVHVMTTVGWRVTDAEKFVTAHPNEAMVEQSLQTCVQDARTAVAQSVKLDDLVTTAPEQREHYAAFERRFLDTVKRNLDPSFGVEVTTLSIAGLALPKDATTTVQDSMAAQRRAIAEQYKQEGESEAAIIKANAESEASRKRADATGEGQRIRGHGDAAAAEYLKVFAQSPEAAKLADTYKRLDALDEAVGPSTLLIVPQTAEPYSALQGEGPGAAAK